ncbi:hypothetical protein GF325_12870 [Candidatus Bathyarchaeota archaeon]|nr:hypothetical protein [Candidatus Bathyarchaeota archaeon]
MKTTHSVHEDLAMGEVSALRVLDRDGNKENGLFHLATAEKRGILSKMRFSWNGKEWDGNLEWDRKIGSPAWSIETIPSGLDSNTPTIFTGREDGHFHAYMDDGMPAWSHSFDATISSFSAYIDPFTNDPLVLIPSIDRTLRLLDAKTGRYLWGDTFASGVNIATERLIQSELVHMIVAGGNDNTVRAYERPARTSPREKNMYPMKWFYKFESYVRDASIANDGTIAAVADDGFLKVLERDQGEIRFSYEHGSFAWKCHVSDTNNSVISSSFQVPVRLGNGSNEYLGNPGIVACHDLESGELLWETAPGDGINVNCWDFATVAGKSIACLGTTRGDILLLLVANGKPMQRIETGSLINALEIVSCTNDFLDVIAALERSPGSIITCRLHL